jgi:hypothetical protein
MKLHFFQPLPLILLTTLVCGVSSVEDSSDATTSTTTTSDSSNSFDATTSTTTTSDSSNSSDSTTSATTSYGLDVSFPIHGRVSTNYLHLDHNRDPSRWDSTPSQYQGMPIQPLGDRQQLYLNHLEGCRRAYAPLDSYKCDSFEYDRMIMNRRQPQSMKNLTEIGFQKIRAPPHLKELIEEFWNKNSNKDKEENWGVGNTYLNHWDSPTTLVSVDDIGLRGSGTKLKEHIWAAASAVMEEWTHQELQPCSLYGIRVYHEGAIMMPHVDRLPLVASAMINVAQDVDEDWPTVSTGDTISIVVASIINTRSLTHLTCIYMCASPSCGI